MSKIGILFIHSFIQMREKNMLQHDITICWVRAWLNHSSNHKKESKTANTATNYITKSAISSQPTKQQCRAANALKLPLQLHYKPINSQITSKQRLLASKKQKKNLLSILFFKSFSWSTTSISHNRKILVPYSITQLCPQLAHVASCEQSCVIGCGTRSNFSA